MILQDIHIKQVDWYVRIYHEANYMCADNVLRDLIRIGCSGNNLVSAKKSLNGDMKNSGFTFSNLEYHRTVMVIGYTSSGAEYWNTLQHEMDHLKQHIIQECKLDPLGEKICYISGEFIRSVYQKVSFLLCDCCRNKV